MPALAAMLCLLYAATVQSADMRMPEGTHLYWDCDRWSSGGWRDNEWADGGSGRIEFDRAVRFHGEAAVRLDGRPEGEVSALSLERPALIETGRNYVLQCWARTEGVQGTAEVRMLAHGPEPGEQYRPLGWVRLSERTHLVLPAGSDWTRYRIPITQLPGGTNRVFLYLRIAGPGTVWFDEVSVADEGVEVPPGGRMALRDEDYAGERFDDDALPENLLTNGSFEEGMAGWVKLPGDYPAQVDQTVAHSGSACFRFDAQEFTGGYIHQRAPIDPRRYYRISLWAKCTGLVGYFYTHLLPFNRHVVPIGWHGANHANEHLYVTGTTNGWEERVLVTRFAPEVASVVMFPRVDDTIGTVWVDDICIQPLPLSYQPEGDGL